VVLNTTTGAAEEELQQDFRDSSFDRYFTYSPNSQMYATVDERSFVGQRSQTMIRIQDLNRRTLASAYLGNSTVVSSVSFSPDSHQLAVVYGGGRLSIFDLQNLVTDETYDNATPLLYTLHEFNPVLRDVVWSKDGSQVFAGYADGTILQWNLTDRTKTFINDAFNSKIPVTNRRAWFDGANIVALNPDETTIYSVGGRVHEWDIKEVVYKDMVRGSGGFSTLNSAAFSDDYRLLALAGLFGDNFSSRSSIAIRVWDMERNRQAMDDIQFSQQTPNDFVTSLTFNADETSLAVAFNTGQVYIYDIGIGEMLYTLESSVGGIYDLAYDKNSDWWYGVGDGTIFVWESSNGNLVRELSALTDSSTHITLSPDGRRIYGITEVQMITELPNQGMVAPSSDATVFESLIGESPKGLLFVLDTASGTILSSANIVPSVDLELHDNRVLVAGGDGVMYLWEVNES
jgi:WD40 repeat protein